MLFPNLAMEDNYLCICGHVEDIHPNNDNDYLWCKGCWILEGCKISINGCIKFRVNKLSIIQQAYERSTK